MTAKTTNILYWTFTILFAALMAFTAVLNLLSSADSITLIHDQLGYPLYFIPLAIWFVPGILSYYFWSKKQNPAK